MTIAKVVARAWKDHAFRSKLLDDPHAALSEVGIDVPADKTVQVHEDADDVRHFVLPEPPQDVDGLTEAQLEAIAGGGSSASGPVIGGPVLGTYFGDD